MVFCLTVGNVHLIAGDEQSGRVLLVRHPPYWRFRFGASDDPNQKGSSVLKVRSRLLGRLKPREFQKKL
jgi:hypothetical protein